MSRSWARDLRPGGLVDEVFHVLRGGVRTSRAGVTYLDLVVGDVTGEVRAKLWDADPGAVTAFEGAGEYVRLKGTVESHLGDVGIRIEGVAPVDPASVDPAAFLHVPPAEEARLFGELRALYGRLAHPDLRRLFDAFFGDEAFCRAFRAAPAAARNHHNYPGGLLEHVHSLARLSDLVAGHYPALDRDVLLAGAFLHDVGKIRELSTGGSIQYTREGELVGHVAIGARLLEDRIRSLPGFPDELRLRLVHLVLSHHGELEWGAPIVPKTLEALVLHQLDNLDARLHMFRKALAAPAEGEFTSWDRTFGRRLYRGETSPSGDDP